MAQSSHSRKSLARSAAAPPAPSRGFSFFVFAAGAAIVPACSGLIEPPLIIDPPVTPLDASFFDSGATPLDASSVTSVAGDTTPLPSSCGPDQAPSGASCFTVAHATGIRDRVMAKGLADVTIASASTASTTNGAIAGVRPPNTDVTTFEVWNGIGFVQLKQASGPGIALWTFTSVDVAADLQVTGDAAAIFVARSDIHVRAGVIVDAGAKGVTPGPGGFAGGGLITNGLGCGGGFASPEGGGGGGAFGGAGGSGGTGIGQGGAGLGGLVCSNDDLTIFHGGSGGAGGDDSDSTKAGSVGGGGGGALQLSALGNLDLEGTLSAGGGGGYTPEGNWRNGSGGGSGGIVYLESPNLGGSGAIATNGGGGGSSSAGTGSSCAAGASNAADGAPGSTPAKGGSCRTPGGAGATCSVAPQAGGNGSNGGSDVEGAGGGGGGLGRVVIATPSGAAPASLNTCQSTALKLQ